MTFREKLWVDLGGSEDLGKLQNVIILLLMSQNLECRSILSSVVVSLLVLYPFKEALIAPFPSIAMRTSDFIIGRFL
ncbi:hypothetical protein HKBW3S25_00450 [Candidatus Hakubella thermalkaliphila]|uniref:Uncharacterized protein n=2 Tax=Candidatus Hakubella thermalkaliphila TaxID=2754717 RepID=A0A6V8NZW8_9ACTN|nr:hypothetical protein HKBW3S25_00450 [Candidatus Hakubella thermalkaliphila]